ncbi:MAG: type II and III secretion system protein [Balneolaceae bacterium]|nr:type II and III secretion system protein [Balneolaceae bacterium]
MSSSLFAQIVDPLKEYTNPDEIVTFDKGTTFGEALDVINTFSLEYEDRFIVNNTNFEGAIGVSLPPMHWKEALQYIVRFQNLTLDTYEKYYEINPPAPDSEQGVQQGGGTQATSTGPDINTETREIRINATFFEGNKRALREIGVDWSTLTSDAPANIADFVTGQQSEGIPNASLNDQFVSINSFGAGNVSQNAFNILTNLGEVGPVSVQALFSAFEADNLGKVLATPSVKVVDGQKGNMQVGQDFSIKQRDIAGNVTDEFFSTGTILTVTPQVIDNGDTTFIYMDLAVERSTAQPDVVSTIINKQQATTSAILLDGESTHIAGLYRTEETSIRRGVPILKDLPPWFLGLRYLFGFDSKDYLENELIIIVQAELIEPVSERINNRLQSKREILNQERDRMRTDLDLVFQNKNAQADAVNEMEEEIPPPAKDSVDMEVEDKEQPENEGLTKEKQKLAEELSLPVEYPELMVVVPKAFSLDEYLEYKEKGMEVEEENDLKYFVIGGSFIVKNNAYNFMERLDEAGYNTRMLYNTKTRFHFVAYEGFRKLDTALDELLSIREQINNKAWLFTIEAENEQIKE